MVDVRKRKNSDIHGEQQYIREIVIGKKKRKPLDEEENRPIVKKQRKKYSTKGSKKQLSQKKLKLMREKELVKK